MVYKSPHLYLAISIHTKCLVAILSHLDIFWPLKGPKKGTQKNDLNILG
jgi:hypothetical protein